MTLMTYSGVFIVNFEHISRFFYNVSIVHFKKVHNSWGGVQILMYH